MGRPSSIGQSLRDIPALELLAVLQHIIAADVTKDLCRGQPAAHKINYPVGQKRPADIPTASPELYERPNDDGLRKRLKNPKITNLIDEILNDRSENQSEKDRPIVIQASLPVPTVTDVQPKTNDDMGVGVTKIKSMKTAIRKGPNVEIEINLSKESRWYHRL